MASDKQSVVIIGAGLTGLACAYHLERAGFSPLIVERSSSVGGRLRTDNYRGFLLDRGFHIVFSAAPEISALFDRSDLDLSPFLSAAKFRFEGEWYELRNPLRHPFSTFGTVRFPSSMWPDLLRMMRLYKRVRKGALPASGSAREMLSEIRLGSHFRQTCIRPLAAALLLDRDFSSSARSFATLMRHLGKGYICLPKGGIESVPKALAAKLSKTKIRFETEVSAIEEGRVVLGDGEVVEADATVLAVERPAAARLLGLESETASRSGTCFYFRVAANLVPSSPLLYFDGSTESPINHLAFLNLIEPSYAPRGEVLASVTVLDRDWQEEPHLIDKVRQQLSAWFHTRYTAWNHLRDYKIPHVVAGGPPPFADHLHDKSLFYAGELSGESTINGSLASGREVATAVRAFLDL